MRYVGAAVVVLGALAVGVFYLEREKPGWYAKQRYPLRYEHVIVGNARNYGLDPAVLDAVIYREGKFDPEAGWRSGVVGIMQLVPSTAKGGALQRGGRCLVMSD